jgi:hypothetical protein
MSQFSAVAVFCEDIREEKSGQDSIIGTLPDNMNIPTAIVPGQQALLPKFGCYLRMNLDPQDKPKELSVRLVDAQGATITAGGWEQNVLDKAFSDAIANKMPVVGLIFKVIAAPFPIVAAGQITAIAVVNGTDYVAGALNIIAPSATASPPPS